MGFKALVVAEGSLEDVVSWFNSMEEALAFVRSVRSRCPGSRGFVIEDLPVNYNCEFRNRPVR